MNTCQTIENEERHDNTEVTRVRYVNQTGLAVALLLVLSACASESAKRGAYEAIYQKGCMDRAGKPNCDPEHKSYDQYKKEREESPKQ